MKINTKLAISFVLLYILVPAIFIFPLYNKAETIERVQKEEQLKVAEPKDDSVKKLCEKQKEKEALATKRTCGA